MDGDMDTQLVSDLDHQRAAGALLPALMALKTWVRCVTHLELADHGTTLAALSLLERCGPVRVSDLAEAARLDRSVVSRQVKALHAAGLVRVTEDPEDRRVRRLQLSERGVEVLADGRARMARLVDARLARWSTEELSELSRGLHRLVADLDADLDTDSAAANHPSTPGTHL
jgi:DNA-binding MarR family transcriptional regulator